MQFTDSGMRSKSADSSLLQLSGCNDIRHKRKYVVAQVMASSTADKSFIATCTTVLRSNDGMICDRLEAQIFGIDRVDHKGHAHRSSEGIATLRNNTITPIAWFDRSLTIEERRSQTGRSHPKNQKSLSRSSNISDQSWLRQEYKYAKQMSQ